MLYLVSLFLKLLSEILVFCFICNLLYYYSYTKVLMEVQKLIEAKCLALTNELNGNIFNLHSTHNTHIHNHNNTTANPTTHYNNYPNNIPNNNLNNTPTFPQQTSVGFESRGTPLRRSLYSRNNNAQQTNSNQKRSFGISLRL